VGADNPAPRRDRASGYARTGASDVLKVRPGAGAARQCRCSGGLAGACQECSAQRSLRPSQVPVSTPVGLRALPVSTPDDPHERKAEAMADRVMAMSDRDSVGRAARPATSSPQGGMDAETQSSMERRFGADFSAVRIHTDAVSAHMSRALNAHAFTIGRDIYFASGQYAPRGDRGRHLLAHELAHTVQQGRSPVRQPADIIRQGATGLVNTPEETSLLGPSEEGGAQGEFPALGPEQPETAVGQAGVAQLTVQRSATWTGAAVHETINLADMAFGGGTPITWHMLNGTKLATEADADGAIKVPGVTTSGSGANWEAKVDTVPAQEGSGDETVLSPGPWTRVVTKAQAGAETGLAACTGAGNSTFSANGKPSDDAVYKANRRHENHHLADHQVAFNDAIGAWDTKLQDAKKNGTTFKGASAADATGALWTAMGGTPQNAARSYRNQGFAKGTAYHATAAGGPMTFANPASDATCSTCSEDVTNPS
jgi:hypothetical protein